MQSKPWQYLPRRKAKLQANQLYTLACLKIPEFRLKPRRIFAAFLTALEPNPGSNKRMLAYRPYLPKMKLSTLLLTTG